MAENELSKNVVQVKNILSIGDSKFDNFLTFCETNITNKIYDRCNITVLNEKLNSLIQEFLIEQYNLNKDGIGEGKRIVTGASDNGQTVNFQNVGGVNAMSKNANEFLNANEDVLIAYRKIRW